MTKFPATFILTKFEDCKCHYISYVSPFIFSSLNYW